MRKLLVLLPLALAGTALAQNPEFNFTYRVPPATGVSGVQPNGTVFLGGVQVGRSNQITFIADNRGPTPWTIARPAVSGGPFTVTPATSQLVNPGASGVFVITFAPAAPGQVAGRLTLDFSNDRGANQQFLFFLDGQAIAPEFITSYALASGNQTPIASGEAVPFPGTVAGAASAAVFAITNRGTGAGRVTAVTIAGGGEVFTLAGLPLLPEEVQPNGVLRFTINFQPPARENYAATLRVELEGFPARTFRLTGQGTSAVFSYQWSVGTGAATAVEAGGSFTLPNVAIGTAQTVTFAVRNTGNTPGTINAIGIAGPGFTLIPPVLPARLGQGESLTFSFTFTPAAAGTVQGQLRIDGAGFVVNAGGLGARLTYAAQVNQTETPITGGGFTFPNTVVGAASPMVQVIVRNEGNQAATVAGLSVAPAVFRIPTLPALPARLNPGDSLVIPLQFSPQALGLVAGALQIDDTTIAVRGIGDQPPRLPGVSFNGSAAAVNPLDQPAVGLQLDTAYPYDLTGTLTLSFTSGSFVDDPAIQFASGGRRVDFRIPANTRDALFGAARQVAFQAGTVAGDIVATATFSVGQVNLAPTDPPARTFQVAAGPPQLRSIRIGAQTATTFEVIVSGYATTRSITQINLQFTAATGQSLQTTSLDANVDGAFSGWYQAPESRNFGSQFTASIVVNVSGDIQAVQSVAARATNARGSSSTVSANLR